MKFCPQCTAGFPDSASTCPVHGVMLSEIRDLKPGMMIRRTYCIVRKLGQGGMGSVYLARHTLMDEPRALKFLASEFSSDQAFTSRFLREVRTLRQVRHRNVVDCGDLEPAEDDSLFFSMEFVDGPDLRGFLHAAPQPFDVKQALEIVRGVAQGLGAAHALGLVHRDIKPENILMAQAGEACLPKIADFGIVATKESSGTHTRTGGSLLTPPYAAPEQWRGMRAAELDGRTDLYALGGVLFEMLTGRTAFDAENYEGWAEQHRNTPPPPPSSLRPELANWKGLDALVLRLLAKDREQRPRDVSEVLGLLGVVRYVTPPPRPVTMVEPQRAQTVVEPKSTTPVIADPAQEPEANKPANKPRKRLFWVGEAVIVAVVGIVVFVSWQASRQPQTEPVFDSTTQQPAGGQPESGLQQAAQTERHAEALESKESYKEALPLFAQACTGGNADACDHLGRLYQYGYGAAKSYPKARDSYLKACDAASADGCFHIGSMYDTGMGVAQDPAKADDYYAKGCQAGSGVACNNLASNYALGAGVSPDKAKAHELYSRGCLLGNQAACDWLKQGQ